MENEDLKGFFKVNFRFRCEWKFISVKEEITTTRPENNIINDFQRWKIMQNSPKISNETISESEIKFQTTTTEKAEEKIKNEYDKTTNYVDLPKFKTENNDKEVRIFFIVSIITVAVLLLFIGTMIVLIILCKKKSEKKVTNFPLQSLGGGSE